jgi:hypothetical protein
VQQLIEDHRQSKRDNALKIWALLMIEVWQRMYLDGEPEQQIKEEITGVKKMPVNAKVAIRKRPAEVVSIR